MKGYNHPQGHVFYRKMDHQRPIVSHGEGIYLYDSDGKRYLDGSGGPFVVNVGHGRREIIDAMQEQMEKVAYAHAIMFTSDATESYARALAEVVPLTEARFFFLSSGSEVVEGALKLSRQIQLARGEVDRSIIIGRHQSYHGMTLGALGVSGRPTLKDPFLDMMVESPLIWPPYPYRDSASGKEAAERLERAILRFGPERVAGFIAESISGASLGAVVPPADYWPRIRQICDRYGVLLITDEVLVGFGRTGRWWGIDHWDIEPDILVSSKGAAGGYFPLGFIAAKGADVELIRRSMGDFNHGGTFSHHVVGAIAGLRTLQIIKKEGLIGNAARMGMLLGAQLQAAIGDRPHIGDIRGRGLFWSIELVKDIESKEPFQVEQQVAWDIFKTAFEHGLITYYSQGCADGVNGDIIMVGPPLIADESHVNDIVRILSLSIDEYFRS